MLGGICRVAACLFVVLAAPAAAASTTAWNNNRFDVDVANLVRRSNIIVQSAPTTGPQSMPVGNGTLGAAVWAANGFTAQLNRWDTYPNRRSPGQVTIPGLQAMTGASDYTASVDLYDGTFRQSGGGMTATTYVRADKDELVVDVSGADPAAAQTATISLQSGRNPTAGADNGVARLAETWVDTASFSGGSGRTFGSLAAVTAGGRNVSANVVDARTARVSFTPNANGSFRVIVGSPAWTGGDAAATAATFAADTTGTIDTAHIAWWHDYWSKVGLAKFSSADGSADYMENLRTIFLYIEGASERGTFPTSQAGVNPLFNFSRDGQSWGGGHYWFWNLRMQLAANLGAGNFDFNLPRFNLYTDNLAAIRTWTTLHMNLRPGICVPETMRFDGSGWYTGTDNENASCIADGTSSYNKRNLSSGAEVGLNIWRQFLATDDRAFLDHNYPVMADAARFLLSYATTGADGKLHTFPSNAHESQWDVHDPITDIAAMKALFPVVIAAAQTLGKDPDLVSDLQASLPKLADFPRTDFGHTQLKTAANDGDGNTVLGFSSDPTAAFRNSENLDLEPVFPYDLITDQSGSLFDLAKLTYAHKRNTNSNDWSYDPVDAARLGMGAEVAARLKATTSSFQLFSNGMANLGSSGTLTEPYDEHTGVTALALNEALAQDYDGLLRIAPAVPPEWDAEGTIFIQHRTKVSVQVQGGVITTAAVVSGSDHDIRVKNPWPQAQVVDGANPSQVVVATTSDPIFTIHATNGGTYLIQQASAPTASLPKATLTGTPAVAARHLAGSNAKIGIDPPGYEPPGPCATPINSPLVAWDPASGATVKDASTYGRDGLWVGAPTYLATGPTGTSASIDSGRYLRAAPTTLGYLREATFAAEVKINAGTSYRRLWDWKTAAGGDGDGFLADLTPTGAIRVITSGANITTNATPPTGRFINLVITAGRDGAVNVYVDGTRIGGGTIANLGINGCQAAELRFGADQGGGQRISAELDRTAVFTKVLSATDIARWQQLAFPSAGVDTPVTIGGTVPRTLALSISAASADLGTFLPGVTKDYTASLAATVTTTTADAALSVSDPGHLTNGSFTMPQPLQVNVNGGTYQTAGETLLSYSGPKTLDPVTIGFKQSVLAADGLHTGAYGKTLTFTLSSSAP